MLRRIGFLTAAMLMAPEGDGGGGGGTNTTAPPAPPVPPAPPAPPADPDVTEKGNNVIVPKSAFAQIKKSAEEKGRKAALAEMDKAAQAAGFANHAGMVAHLAKIGKGEQPPAPPGKGKTTAAPAAPGKGAAFRQVNHLQKELQKAQQRADQEKAARHASLREKNKLARRLNEVEVDRSLETIAQSEGVHPEELDYVVARLKGELRGRPKDQMSAFDERKWLRELKVKKPHLFGERIEPADTPPQPGRPVPVPAPGAAPRAAPPPKPGGFDGRTAKPEDVKSHAQKLGLKWPPG